MYLLLCVCGVWVCMCVCVKTHLNPGTVVYFCSLSTRVERASSSLTNFGQYFLVKQINFRFSERPSLKEQGRKR